MPATDHVGLAGPSYEVDIERGKIREFARAMNAPLDEFIKGYAPIIPATFLVSAAYTWGYSLERPRGTVFEEIDHDLSVPLHAGEEFRFFAEPPRAGDRLTARSVLEKVTEKPGKNGGQLTFLTLLTEYRNESRQLVVEQRSTTVTTGRSPSDSGWIVAVPDYQPRYSSIDAENPFTGIERVGADELMEGKGPGEVNAGPLLLRDIVRFQGVVGEDNPLHHDVPWAQSCNYPTVFGLGMHQASLLASYAAHWVTPVALRYFKARFHNVYWPGEELIYDGNVNRINAGSDEGRMVELSMTCRRPNGDLLVDVQIHSEF